MSVLGNLVPDEGQSLPEKEGVDQDQPLEKPKQYLTREELEAALEERDQRLMTRVQQSSRDRQKLITDQLNSMKELLQSSKVTVTPEMEKDMRQQIEQKLDGGQPAQPEQPGQRKPPANEQEAAAQFIFDETQTIFNDEGLKVSENDPEWKIIKAALDDPHGNLTKYRKAVLKAVDTKRTRTQDQEENADARVNGSGGRRSSVTDISAINDSDKLYEMGEEQIRKGNSRR